jgi:hypothetical protein
MFFFSKPNQETHWLMFVTQQIFTQTLDQGAQFVIEHFDYIVI